MNNKQKIIVSVTGIFLVLLLLVGLTYGYFLTKITGNTNTKSISVSTANLALVYGDGNGTITAENIQPGYSLDEKTFTVKNEGNATTSYSIILEDMINELERNQDLTYTLNRTDTNEEIASGYIAVGKHQILSGIISIEVGKTHSYSLSIKYEEAGVDQSIDMNKEFSAKINIGEENPTWETPREGTLLALLKANNEVEEPLTIPGQATSLETEALLASTEDDYGISYYFRGNVSNNYVTYSNMCWRIVRVQGDGTIKLVLADENHQCGTTNGYSVSDNDSAFINNGTKDCYGTIYDAIISGNYDGYDADNSGNLLKVLNAWIDYKRLNTINMVETDWCNGLSGKTLYYNYSDGSEIPIKNLESTSNYYYIDLFGTRFYNDDDANLTLKCNGTPLWKSAEQRYVGKIALLTADEVAFAGSTAYQSEITYDYYLQTNANGEYWTMSPAYYHGAAAHSNIFVVESNGSLSNLDNFKSSTSGAVPDKYKLVRPSIVLNSNVSVSSTTQDGTLDNPYVIQ